MSIRAHAEGIEAYLPRKVLQTMHVQVRKSPELMDKPKARQADGQQRFSYRTELFEADGDYGCGKVGLTVDIKLIIISPQPVL